MNTFLWIVLLVVATALVVWLLPRLLAYVNRGVGAIGDWAHRAFDLPSGEDKDAWLFAMLVSVTKIPAVFFGATAVAVAGLSYIFPASGLVVAGSLFNAAFLLVFTIRILAMLVGSVIFGSALISAAKSLQA